jgi:hypothetical protein
LNKQLNYTELGLDKITDFSGENKTNKQLHYMDYKLAHSINRLIDPSLLSKKTNPKNINDVQMERENIPTHFTDREQVDYAKYLNDLEKKEHKRVINMHKMDEQILKQFDSVNKRMISYKT